MQMRNERNTEKNRELGDTLPKVISIFRIFQAKAVLQIEGAHAQKPSDQKCLHPGSAQIEGAYTQEAPKLKVQSAGKKG